VTWNPKFLRIRDQLINFDRAKIGYSLSKFDKIVQKILNGLSDQNIDFPKFLNMIINLGFELRQKGSHHILTKDGIEEIINIQPKNGKAKAYQVKQFSEIIIKYRLNSTIDG
jgi:hypothetical protein